MALAPPFLPQVMNGQIPTATIQSAGGIIYQILRNENSAVDDVIEIYWDGIFIGHYTISNPYADFPIVGFVPLQLVRRGINIISYTITDRLGNPGSSEPLEVFVAISLSMIISTGAANFDFDAIRVNPFNRGVVYGNPGARIRLDIIGQAYFYETDERFFELNLDSTGQGFFRLWSNEQSANFVLASDMTSGMNSTQTTVFGPFRNGEDKILRINYTTGAPANDLTYNSIYLLTDIISNRGNIITHVRAQVNGNATIVGYTQTADILLNSDQSATINIIDPVAEQVRVILSLPQASGSEVILNTVFVSQPVGISNTLSEPERYVDAEI
ncbi:hypothetical protein [Sodalis sp. dw_96]|uniref:hypothetical protein n=1 Tax=Sodalis sp. dw_96 TaxID=2719794 RepID=UPI001BD6626C|nr:hypothetical protein [Sodalis sp. dw_96]